MIAVGCHSATGGSTKNKDAEPQAVSNAAVQFMFDGKTLGKWKPTEFFNKGEVTIQDGSIILGRGNDMTGVTWTGPVLRTNYEVEWEGKRLEGNDFFCALTFPFGDTYCSLIAAGWSNYVAGLSTINGYSANENETTHVQQFENDKWYKFRLRVTPRGIEAWIDDAKVVDFEAAPEKKIDIRFEMQESRPLGFSTWRTVGAVRNIRLRKLTAEGF